MPGLRRSLRFRPRTALSGSCRRSLARRVRAPRVKHAKSFPAQGRGLHPRRRSERSDGGHRRGQCSQSSRNAPALRRPGSDELRRRSPRYPIAQVTSSSRQRVAIAGDLGGGVRLLQARELGLDARQALGGHQLGCTEIGRSGNALTASSCSLTKARLIAFSSIRGCAFQLTSALFSAETSYMWGFLSWL